MVSAFGYYASAKGMVLVPNLSGLTRTNAITAIQNAGLTPVAGSVVNTGDSGLDDIIASQTPASGTLVNYETNVQYDYYDFVPVGPFFPPFFPPYFPTFTPPFFPPYFPTFVPTPSVSVSAIVNSGTSVTVNWLFTNFTQGSFQLTRTGAGQYPIFNGSDTTLTDPTLTCNSTYTWSFVFYSGPNGTGDQLTGSVTATTAACPPGAYTVTYDCNGGTGCPANTTHNGSYTIPSTVPTRSGFTLGGYQVTCGGNFIGDYQPGATVNCTGNLVLQARWVASGGNPFFPPYFPFFAEPFFPPYFPFFPPFFPPYFPFFEALPPLKLCTSLEVQFGCFSQSSCCNGASGAACSSYSGDLSCGF